ncbi:hypothetical protein Taro_040195, partial [Colocasia esculenta]|nr:hypothetical protein [Colocasia esculenta]
TNLALPLYSESLRPPVFRCFFERGRRRGGGKREEHGAMDASKPVADVASGAATRTSPPLPHLANGYASGARATAPSGRAVEEGVGEGGGAVASGRGAEVEGFRHRVDEIVTRVDELEQRVNEVAQFYSCRKQPNGGSGNKGCGGGAISVAKEKEKFAIPLKKPADVARKDAVCTRRMQELMRQFGTILRQASQENWMHSLLLSQHKYAWPFMQPVDVEGLGLHDYYEIIKKPMDFDTIRNRMEVKDGTGYKNVREIYADVRLVFTNAMTYNDERNDIHQMAKTLLDKFEEKWLQLLPKVIEEETRLKDVEAKVQAEMQMAQEAAIAKIAKDTDTELNELSVHLEELREMVLPKCRKMSTEEKRKLGAGLSRLSPEDLNRALEIIAQNNPTFQATAEEVDLDMDALSESTLWRLKFFVKEALEVQAKGSATKNQDNTKRKREICDALAKTAKKRSRKVS